MTTEKEHNNLSEMKSSEELVFVDKEKDCIECDKEKEIQITFGLSTKDEWERVMKMIDRYGLSRQEIDYIYGFYNREFKENKSPGCGKCFVNITRNLKRKWERLNQGQPN